MAGLCGCTDFTLDKGKEKISRWLKGLGRFSRWFTERCSYIPRGSFYGSVSVGTASHCAWVDVPAAAGGVAVNTLYVHN